jgi:hypothetical protein
MADVRVKKIKDWCLENYDKGGHWIIETMTDQEISDNFKSLAEAKRYCKTKQDYSDDICNA